MTMNTELAISTKKLARYFGSKPVVRDIDFDVPTGSVTALLGLNGAGKSTTIRMLMGLLEPTRGTVTVLGKDSMHLGPEDRARIGYTIEGHYICPWMRVRDAQRYQRDTFPQWDEVYFNETLRRFSIDPSQRIRQLSRGQRAGVSVALTLAAQPELLVLDDPALGLDPVSRRCLNETLLDFC
ncbi:MAG TPA: ABC transporter ATP-binding protein, partial [Planctomycetaceae bacterium]|nr:ABC transporter ATP-binding protein [Planctomycetaceae bacterium]